MAIRQRRPRNTCTPIACTLPADLMLEIVACSNLSTLVHCAATNKDLRREILSPPFIRRVSQQGGIVPPRIHAYLRTGVGLEASLPPLSLASPATPAAAAFFKDHLSPFVARSAADLLAGYRPMTSRGGLVLLRRRNIYRRMKSMNCSNLCVYDLITGHRTFFVDPPNIFIWWHACVLLAAPDGIGCLFSVLVAKVDHHYADNECTISVQIATPSKVGDASWGPVMKYTHIGLPSEDLRYNRDSIVLHGGVIHFPMFTYDNETILTYNVHTKKVGIVKLPHINSKASQRHLGTSPDGMLQFLTADGFKISVWLQLIDGDWALETVIDTEEKLRSLDPDILSGHAMIEFMDKPGEKSGPVLLQIRHPDMWLHDDELPIIDVGDGGPLINFDLETKEMHKQNPASSPAVLLEIDMVSHLQGMTIFS